MEVKKVANRRIVYETNCSFKYEGETQLTTAMHCHDEYELLYVTAGSGRAFVGDSVFDYGVGDMVLIGSHLPHLFLTADSAPRDATDSTSSRADSRCSLLQFPRALFPADIDAIPEYASVADVLHKSRLGIRFNSVSTKYLATRLMKTLNRQRGVNRIFSLLRILDLLSRSDDQQTLATSDYAADVIALSTDDPVAVLCNYIMNHHKHRLTLDDLAAQVSMKPASLCRYFKARTGKTLFQYIGEIRVEYACRLLRSTNLTVSNIAWESGFENLSYFNSKFLQLTHQTPTAYRTSILAGSTIPPTDAPD